MHSLENSLIDIMRAEQDTLKGKMTIAQHQDRMSGHKIAVNGRILQPLSSQICCKVIEDSHVKQLILSFPFSGPRVD